MSMELSESLETYLETIYEIIELKQAVRVKDIASKLNVKNPSVTGALRSLADKEFINYEPYGVITLTESGKNRAKELARKHEALRNYFVNVLAIDNKEADEAACQLEHVVGQNIIDRFVKFFEFVERCPCINIKWDSSGYQCNNADDSEKCSTCLASQL